MSEKIYTQEDLDKRVAEAISEITKLVRGSLHQVKTFDSKMNDLLWANKVVMFYLRTKHDSIDDPESGTDLTKDPNARYVVKVIDDIGALSQMGALKENEAGTFQRALLEMEAITDKDVSKDFFGYEGKDIVKLIEKAVENGETEINVIGRGEDDHIPDHIKEKAHKFN